jgi:hypothetical protein
MGKNKDKTKEIISYSKELMSFDLENISVEELDRRLELAVANIMPQLGAISCGVDCGSYCGVFTCTSNCAVNLGCTTYIRKIQS